MIATNVLSMTSSEKMVSREEAQYPDKVLQMDTLASVNSLMADVHSPLPRVQEDLVGRVGLHQRILRRFSSKSSCFHHVFGKHN